MSNEARRDWKTDLLERLHSPVQLRLFLTGLVLLAGYASSLPLEGRLSETSSRLRAERRRLNLARDVEQLRADDQALQKRLPAPPAPSKASAGKSKRPTRPGPGGADGEANEWQRYMLGGIRRLPVKLVLLESDRPHSLGPFRVVGFQIALEGSFGDLHAFLTWLDTNERLMRVERVLLEPLRDHTALSLRVTVLGIMG